MPGVSMTGFTITRETCLQVGLAMFPRGLIDEESPMANVASPVHGLGYQTEYKGRDAVEHQHLPGF